MSAVFTGRVGKHGHFGSRHFWRRLRQGDHLAGYGMGSYGLGDYGLDD